MIAGLIVVFLIGALLGLSVFLLVVGEVSFARANRNGKAVDR